VTAAGPAHDKKPVKTDHLIDAINQVFALFRINYHNQFYSAYADTELLNQAKRLWLESLSRFSETQILSGAKKVIETSDYLPTLNRMIQRCEEQYNTEGLPSPHDAYLEACNASSPKAAAKWSHLAVYYAGAETGWYRLSHEAEATSFPAYREHYRRICQDIAQGRTLEAPSQAHLIEAENKPTLSKAQSRKELKRLKETLGFG
jgi:hypothetical protein